MSRFTVSTFMQDAQGHRARQVNGFDGASVLVRGERSEEIANAIVERFSQQGAPRRPLGKAAARKVRLYNARIADMAKLDSERGACK